MVSVISFQVTPNLKDHFTYISPHSCSSRTVWAAAYLEDLALGGAEHDDAAELGERDAGQHGGAHARERARRARHARAAARHAEAVHHVRAELHRDAHRHHLRHTQSYIKLLLVCHFILFRNILVTPVLTLS